MKFGQFGCSVSEPPLNLESLLSFDVPLLHPFKWSEPEGHASLPDALKHLVCLDESWREAENENWIL